MASKLEEAVETCKLQMKQCKIKCNDKLLTAIAKSLGPSLYKRDAMMVAASNKSEIDTIKKNFIKKKLKVEGPAADKAIAHAVDKLGSSNRHKRRPVFYYLITEKLKKQSVFS